MRYAHGTYYIPFLDDLISHAHTRTHTAYVELRPHLLKFKPHYEDCYWKQAKTEGWFWLCCDNIQRGGSDSADTEGWFWLCWHRGVVLTLLRQHTEGWFRLCCDNIQRGGSDSAATTYRGMVPTLLIQRGGSDSAAASYLASYITPSFLHDA